MDSFWVNLTGKNLDSDRVVKIFEAFKVRPRRTMKDASVEVSAIGSDLLSFLNEVENRLNGATSLKIDDVQVWALLERDGQINGELSVDEIACLQRLNACFCWSVIVKEPDVSDTHSSPEACPPSRSAT